MKHSKAKLFLLYIGSFLTSVAPLTAVLIAKWDTYTGSSPASAFKLCTGGAMVAVFVFLKVVGKLKVPRGIVLFGTIFVMCYLLQAILSDLLLLSGMALAGEAADCAIFQWQIKNYKTSIEENKKADLIAEKIDEKLRRIGRV